MWTNPSYNTNANNELSTYKINVYARFRPIIDRNTTSITSSNEDGSEEGNVIVSLPLHQRLALIKMSKNITNNKAALKVHRKHVYYIVQVSCYTVYYSTLLYTYYYTI